MFFLKDLSQALVRDFADTTSVDIVLCPPFTSIKAVSDVVSETQIQIGSQNISSFDDGAYTGETSIELLKELNCKYIISGHSERRSGKFESSEIVRKKINLIIN